MKRERKEELKTTSAYGGRCYHTWLAMKKWSGRYKCKWCGAIAYRVIAATPSPVGRPLKNAAEIIPYACSRKPCPNPATRLRPSLCWEHRGAKAADRPIPQEEIGRLLNEGAKSSEELDKDLKRQFQPDSDLKLD